MDFSFRCPYEFFHLTDNLQGRMHHQVHSVSLQVLKVVNAILHTNEIVQRTHCPKVIRAETPTNMPDGSYSIISGDWFITNNRTAIHHSNDATNLKFASILIVVVSIEFQHLNIVGHQIFVVVTKSIHTELDSLLEVFLSVATSSMTHHLTLL